MKILGVRIDPVTRAQTQKKLRGFLESDQSHLLTTPNPEMLVLANKDDRFRKVFGQSSLNVPDGFGLRVGARLLGKNIPERVTGVEMVEMLAQLAHERGERVAFLGGEFGEGVGAARALKEQFPKLNIYVFEGGGVSRARDGSWLHHPEIFNWLQEVEPQILCVAFGHGNQECWIHDHLHHFPSVRVAVGVGGAFNYLSGRARRAPRWMQKIGLEWLWRLCCEPHRFRRIVNAVIVFPVLVLRRR